jgi:hypothetical protein
MIKFRLLLGMHNLCLTLVGRVRKRATPKHHTGQVGTVFELDLQVDKTAQYDSAADEKIKVKFDTGNSTTALVSDFRLVKRASW